MCVISFSLLSHGNSTVFVIILVTTQRSERLPEG